MPDHRQAGKVTYPLDEILLLCLLAVLAGAEAFTDIARFGEKKLDLLRRFRPYRDGTPAHDHLGDIFATLDAQAFQRCFVALVAAPTKTPAEVIAIDGKTSRRSYQKKGSKEPSTWCRPSPRASVSSWGRSRWRKNPMRSSPFPPCST
jgi:hypothetical protein